MTSEKKKDLKFVIVFIAIVLFSFCYLSIGSYSKYRKKVTANTNLNIAEWNIKLNNESIINKSTLSNDIIPEFEGNAYTKDSVIAPGTSGYCDIIINGKNVDVNFNYSITAEVSEESTIKDLKITEYIINPSETNTTKIAYNNSSITGNIIHNSTEDTVIRLYIIWDDSETNIMDNAEDTSAATSSTSNALITIKANFSQQID